MNYKWLYTLSKTLIPHLGASVLLMLYTVSTYGQADVMPYVNDVAKQRLLIHITAHYLFTASQGQIDMDSAIRIPCKIYGLSPLLAYNEGYSVGKPSRGSKLLDAGKEKEAITLLDNLHEKARLQLLLELGAYFVFKPGTEKADLDLGSRYVQEAIILSKSFSSVWKLESLILQAHLLHQSGLGDESHKVFTQAVELCKQSENELSLGRVLLNAGKLLPYGHPSRLSNFEKARSIFQAHHAKEKEIETLSEMTIEHFVFKRLEQAKQSAIKTIELEKQIGYRHQQYAYEALSYMALSEADYTKGFLYNRKGLESLSSQADRVFLSFFLIRQGELYMFSRKFDEALKSMSKALENKSKETRLYWYKSFLLKSSLLVETKRPKEALTLLKETEDQYPANTPFEKAYFAFTMGAAYEAIHKDALAEEYYTTFLRITDNFPPEYIFHEFPTAITDIAQFFSSIGKIKTARQLMETAKSHSLKQGPYIKALFYNQLFRIDSTERRYLDAIKNLQISQTFLDSSLTQQQLKNVDELLVKYETDKKDRNIQLLKQQGELQQVKLQQFQFSQRATFIGSGLLLLIVGLLYYLYRTKQKSNTQLKHLLTEKEWLLKEVHHRVKNNLQTVLSLLESQSRRQLSKEALFAFQESQNRVYAMSLIHKKLYQSTDVASIDMKDYLQDLVQNLRESFGNSDFIRFSLEFESICLDVSQAVPVGLIVNEAITNVIKYAFSEKNHHNEVFVSLKNKGDKIDLTISDNGVGMKQAQTKKPQNLGLKLMKGLTEDIDGFFTMNTEKGVSIQVVFAPNIPFQRINTKTFSEHEIQSA